MLISRRYGENVSHSYLKFEDYCRPFIWFVNRETGRTLLTGDIDEMRVLRPSEIGARTPSTSSGTQRYPLHGFYIVPDPKAWKRSETAIMDASNRILKSRIRAVGLESSPGAESAYCSRLQSRKRCRPGDSGLRHPFAAVAKR